MKTAIVLAGGLGTRLGLARVPKAMLKIAGKTLIQHQLDWLDKEGYKNVVICLGHLAENVRYTYSHEMNVVQSIEEDPLGTAGAVQLAFENNSELFTDGCLIVNVDDLCFHPVIKKSELPLNIPAIVTKKIPYSVWIEGTMFAQNEARQHVGHTWLPVNYLSKLPVKGSLEKCLAIWSKEGKVASIDTEYEWFTANTLSQLKEARNKWTEIKSGVSSVKEN